MDFEEIKRNLLDALANLLSLRLIVSSPNEKTADLPALYALAAVLIAPRVCVALVLLGLIFRYRARFERDAVRR